MYGVHEHTDAELYNLPPTSLGQKNVYHEVCFGKKPASDHYAGITRVPKLTNKCQREIKPLDSTVASSYIQTAVQTTEPQMIKTSILANKSIDELIDEETTLFKELVKPYGHSEYVATYVLKYFRKMRTGLKTSLGKFITSSYESNEITPSKTSYANKMIPVTPAGIKRRVAGPSKGKASLKSGPRMKRDREEKSATCNDTGPPTKRKKVINLDVCIESKPQRKSKKENKSDVDKENKQRPKKVLTPHNLSYNVKKGKSNAKKH